MKDLLELSHELNIYEKGKTISDLLSVIKSEKERGNIIAYQEGTRWFIAEPSIKRVENILFYKVSKKIERVSSQHEIGLDKRIEKEKLRKRFKGVKLQTNEINFIRLRSKNRFIPRNNFLMKRNKSYRNGFTYSATWASALDIHHLKRGWFSVWFLRNFGSLLERDRNPANFRRNGHNEDYINRTVNSLVDFLLEKYSSTKEDNEVLRDVGIEAALYAIGKYHLNDKEGISRSYELISCYVEFSMFLASWMGFKELSVDELDVERYVDKGKLCLERLVKDYKNLFLNDKTGDYNDRSNKACTQTEYL